MVEGKALYLFQLKSYTMGWGLMNYFTYLLERRERASYCLASHPLILLPITLRGNHLEALRPLMRSPRLR